MVKSLGQKTVMKPKSSTAETEILTTDYTKMDLTWLLLIYQHIKKIK